MFITRNELKQELKISELTLRRMEREGLPSIKLGHSRVRRYDLEKVITYLESETKQPSAV
jgi:hypothetical protein